MGRAQSGRMRYEVGGGDWAGDRLNGTHMKADKWSRIGVLFGEVDARIPACAGITGSHFRGVKPGFDRVPVF